MSASHVIGQPSKDAALIKISTTNVVKATWWAAHARSLSRAPVRRASSHFGCDWSQLPGAVCDRLKGIVMDIHRKILEWQAAHATITWIVWGIIWIIVLILLFRPTSTGGAP